MDAVVSPLVLCQFERIPWLCFPVYLLLSCCQALFPPTSDFLVVGEGQEIGLNSGDGLRRGQRSASSQDLRACPSSGDCRGGLSGDETFHSTGRRWLHQESFCCLNPVVLLSQSNQPCIIRKDEELLLHNSKAWASVVKVRHCKAGCLLKAHTLLPRWPPQSSTHWRGMGWKVLPCCGSRAKTHFHSHWGWTCVPETPPPKSHSPVILNGGLNFNRNQEAHSA